MWQMCDWKNQQQVMATESCGHTITRLGNTFNTWLDLSWMIDNFRFSRWASNGPSCLICPHWGSEAPFLIGLHNSCGIQGSPELSLGLLHACRRTIGLGRLEKDHQTWYASSTCCVCCHMGERQSQRDRHKYFFKNKCHFFLENCTYIL